MYFSVHANCILCYAFSILYPDHILQRKACIFVTTLCILWDANIVLPLLVPPFFSSLLPPRGKYFSLLEESNSARYANGALLLKEILFNLPPNSYLAQNFIYHKNTSEGALTSENSGNSKKSKAICFFFIHTF